MEEPIAGPAPAANLLVSVLPLLLIVAICAFTIVCYWRIWSKAGFSGAWSLLMLIPLVNIGALAYLAFTDWPVGRGAPPSGPQEQGP